MEKQNGRVSQVHRHWIGLSVLEGQSIASVARRFNVSRSTVKRIRDEALADPFGAEDRADLEYKYRMAATNIILYRYPDRPDVIQFYDEGRRAKHAIPRPDKQ